MAQIISYEIFLFYQARCREERIRRREAAEHLKRINNLLGIETDSIYKEEDP